MSAMPETPAAVPPERAEADGVIRDVAPGRSEALLPVPTVQCHAANLALLPSGGIACVWFGGTQEGTHDTSVYLSVSESGADRFGAARRMSADPDRSEQNPLLFIAPTGQWWLLYTAQRAGNQDTAEVRVRTSPDGQSWTGPRTLIPADGRGGVFVRQAPVVLDDGRWVLPVFRCVHVPGEQWAGNRDISSVWVSDDDGGTWAEYDVPGSTGAVHMNIVRQPDGGYRSVYRSRWADRIYTSDSADGVTWSAPVASELPNNNSSIQAAMGPDGTMYLVYNHSSAADAVARRESLYDEITESGTVQDAAARRPDTPSREAVAAASSGRREAFWGAPRAPLSLTFSKDGGRSWLGRIDLADGDGYCLSNDSRHGKNRELSYPSICVDDDGTVHVAYTHHRSAITYVRLSPEWVAPRLGGQR